jgi:hypothetical protein
MGQTAGAAATLLAGGLDVERVEAAEELGARREENARREEMDVRLVVEEDERLVGDAR